MPDELAVLRKDGNRATITLNRPKANALAPGILGELRNALAACQEDDAVRAVVLTAGESRFFSIGADLDVLNTALDEPLAPGGLLLEGLATVDALASFPKPVIAAVDGIATGGGCELTLACHFRMASSRAKFGLPEVKIGIIPGWGGCHRLPRLVGESRALEWLATGRLVPAQEALQAGLLVKVTAPEELMDAAQAFAGELAERPPTAVRAILRTVRESAYYPERGKALEAEGLAETIATQDAREGVAAFLEKRPPRFTGA